MQTLMWVIEALAAIAVMASIVFTAATYAGLPSRIATHLNAALEPDGWGSKSFLVLAAGVQCGVAAVYYWYLTFAPPFLAKTAATKISAAVWGCLALAFLTLVQVQFIRTAQGKSGRPKIATALFAAAIFVAMISTFYNALRG